MHRKLLFFAAVFAFMAVALNSTVSAQVEASGETEEPAGPAIDPADLESFLDGVIQGRMQSFHVAGVTVSVVFGGRPIFAKGYGYADVETRTPVDPASTLFRPGSISKTFTWTSVMQLVEEGKLKLNEDIRNYIRDVPIPDTYPEPITLSDLMAHTPGFEDAMFGHIFGRDPDAVIPLEEYLRKFQPRRVRPPGKKISYSNYGSALAGHIVAAVSGLPFEDYIEQKIFWPLEMNHSTFREPWRNLDMDPMPRHLLEQSSSGFAWENGKYEPKPFEFIHHGGPAGAMSTTATDMARWMLMHLGEGTLDGVQILSAETAREMHLRHFSHGDSFNGFAHGFIEGLIGPYRTIGHSGGTLYFISQMVMVPELGFGLFASSNTSGGMSVVSDLPNLVVERYFPADDIPKKLQPPEDFMKRAEKYTGTYLNPRRSYTQIEKLYGLIANAARVTANEDGFLIISGSVEAERFVETAPLTFRSVDSEEILEFVEDPQGRIIGLIIKGNYMDRAGFFENLANLAIVTFLALLACLGIMIAAWYRRKLHKHQTKGEQLANAVLVTTSGCWLMFFIVLALAMARMSGPEEVIFGFPPLLLVVSLAIALIAVILTFFCIVLLYPMWRGGQWGMGRRIRHTLAVAVLAVLALMLNSLNIIGFKYF